MINKKNTTQNNCPEFIALKQHSITMKKTTLNELFKKDSKRFENFSIKDCNLTFDYSKNYLDHKTIELLISFGKHKKIEENRNDMFKGKYINISENRPVLHTLLRDQSNSKFILEGENLTKKIKETQKKIEIFSEKIRQKRWLGFSGKPIKYIINVGIGGSDLGPSMIHSALRQFTKKDIEVFFLSNVDAHALETITNKISADTSLFIISSKTFNTQETLLNAQTLKNWFLKYGEKKDISKHFVAVSTNLEAVKKFGIDKENIFPFWNWVGGRYSLWSSIGLVIAISIGMKNFRALLKGANEMDQHFCKSPLGKNMPVIMALTAFWYRQFFKITSQLISPYHDDLKQLPIYFQQLEMESNGKNVTKDGKLIKNPTSPVIWGSVGTDGQHSYFQMLHQGTDIIPVDFIAVLKPNHNYLDHHKTLLANCFAQAEALMIGNQNSDKSNRIDRSDPYSIFVGNRPSNMIILDELNPKILGSLIALYEHKTFIQGSLWNINSFDQWGVEIGKKMTEKILKKINLKKDIYKHDSSTENLIKIASNFFKKIS